MQVTKINSSQNSPTFAAKIVKFELPERFANSKDMQECKKLITELGDDTYEVVVNTWTKAGTKDDPWDVKELNIGDQWTTVGVHHKAGSGGGHRQDVIFDSDLNPKKLYEKVKEICDFISEEARRMRDLSKLLDL